MPLRPLRPSESPPPIWLLTPPPPCIGTKMLVYRGVQSNVRLVAGQFLRSQDVGAGGLMSRDPAAASIRSTIIPQMPWYAEVPMRGASPVYISPPPSGTTSCSPAISSNEPIAVGILLR